MTFTRFTTAGAGFMGSQVAWQMAFHGKDVTVYDAIDAGLEKGKALHQAYADHFMKQRGATRAPASLHIYKKRQDATRIGVRVVSFLFL